MGVYVSSDVIQIFCDLVIARNAQVGQEPGVCHVRGREGLTASVTGDHVVFHGHIIPQAGKGIKHQIIFFSVLSSLFEGV